jgi:hypothetical protein
LLSDITHVLVRGTHETAFRLLPGSIDCVWLGGEANAVALPSADTVSVASSAGKR